MSWILLTFACESMSNPGNPFAPVAMVSTKQVMGGDVGTPIEPAEEISDEFRDPQEVIEMGAITDVESGSVVQVESSTETVATQGGQGLLVDPGQYPKTVVTPEMQQNSGFLPAQTIVTQALESVGGAAPVAGTSGNSGWPVRLVGTMSDAQPPRAVLGFATGEEVVVTPGTLLPAHQIVVMSIGASQVQLAKIVPMGDRANVQSISLQAAYPE